MRCPICLGEADEDRTRNRGDHHWINCLRCGGLFEIGGLYCDHRWKQSAPLYDLSGAIRHAFERGETIPQLTQWSAQELQATVPTTAEGKAVRLLEAIARRAPHPGEVATLAHDLDYPLAYATNGVELRAFVAYLRERGWIGVQQEDDTSTTCTLTVTGLVALDSTKSLV